MNSDDKSDGFLERAADKAREMFGGERASGAGGDGGRASAYRRVDSRVEGADGDRAHPYREDPHYLTHRARHLDEFDRDYDSYRREHAATTDDNYAGNDFTAWRLARRGSADGPPIAATTRAEAASPSDRALGETAQDRGTGPHILDKSFAGTYDKD